jgi:hypothetical protein
MFLSRKKYESSFYRTEDTKESVRVDLVKEMMIILSNKDNQNGLVAKESQDSQRMLELPKHLSLLKNKTLINHSK